MGAIIRGASPNSTPITIKRRNNTTPYTATATKHQQTPVPVTFKRKVVFVEYESEQRRSVPANRKHVVDMNHRVSPSWQANKVASKPIDDDTLL
jgi:hypothetical protein